MIPVDSAHIAHQTHRDPAPARSQAPVRHGTAPVRHGTAPVRHGTAPVRHGAAPVRHGATPVRHGATPPRQAQAGHGTEPKTPAAEIADVPGMAGLSESATTAQATTSGSAAIPGVAEHQSTASTPYQRHQPTQMTAPVQGTISQQAFIDEIAPGAIATQQKYGVPAAVTIAQAIDESGWGQSQLATQDNNLFGIKGAGPAGSNSKPTQEYENGQWVTINAGFRVYNNVAQSIDDHGALLATSGYYTRAMADRSNPDAFANALTGVYATNPNYGSDLIQLMQQYNLYRYDASGTATGATADASGTGAGPGHPRQRPGEGHRQARQADAAFAARAHANGLRVTGSQTHARTLELRRARPRRRPQPHTQRQHPRRRGPPGPRRRPHRAEPQDRGQSPRRPRRVTPHQRPLPPRPGPHPERAPNTSSYSHAIPVRTRDGAPETSAYFHADSVQPRDGAPKTSDLVPRRLGPDPPRLRQRQPRGFRGWGRLRRRPQRHSHALHGRSSHARPGRHGREPRGRRSRSRRGRTTPGGPRVRGSPWRP